MQNSKYFRYPDNAELIFQITTLWPFILWTWFGSQLLKHIVSANSKIGIRISRTIAFPIYFLHIIVLLLWLIPVIIALRSLYYTTLINNNTGKLIFDPTTPSLPPGFGYCLETKIKKEDSEKGAIAYWNYNCEDKNNKLIIGAGEEMLRRFYYINYAIFLIVLLVYNAMNKFNILNNKFILLNIRVALLLGVLGCILPVFGQFYYRSLWVRESWKNLLSMNCICLMLIGLSIMSYSRRWV